MTDTRVLDQAAVLLNLLRGRGWMVATAESCTGGLIAAALTEIAGSSDVMDRGFVTYSNDAKTTMLGVDPALIVAHGAVSAPVAAAMAAGALARSQSALAISVTGIAGPGGGGPDKPVGLVWFGLAQRGAAVQTESQVFTGDRSAVRSATVRHALTMMQGATA